MSLPVRHCPLLAAREPAPARARPPGRETPAGGASPRTTGARRPDRPAGSHRRGARTASPPVPPLTARPRRGRPVPVAALGPFTRGTLEDALHCLLVDIQP